jgi:hypothetical protein
MSEPITRAEWEAVNATTHRLLVPGGWLYRTWSESLAGGTVVAGTVNVTFVPRPEGWKP